MLSHVSQSPTDSLNIQVVMAAVIMNQDIVALEKVQSFDVSTATAQPDIVVSDLTALIDAIDMQIEAITSRSTMASVSLYDALYVLKSNIATQRDKVRRAMLPNRYIDVPRPRPALSLAHGQTMPCGHATSAQPSCLHPLFMSGSLGMRTDA